MGSEMCIRDSKKNVKKGGPSKTLASSIGKAKAKAKAKAKQPPEETAGESPEAEEAMTTPAAMEDVNLIQQYGYPGGGPPPQYGYPGGWALSQYGNGYPNPDPVLSYHYQDEWNWPNPGYPSYVIDYCRYLVPPPPPEIPPQPHILLQ